MFNMSVMRLQSIGLSQEILSDMMILPCMHYLRTYITELSRITKNGQVNPGPADPGYTLPLLTV